ncbi:MAG: alpha-ketoglutarate-dependent dioxygenase AlkB [Planctomycetia bacterium]|nr:alpha-ketoglutarate-dependent dioxygenase AlkB [Planctomycetia bacterium]
MAQHLAILDGGLLLYEPEFLPRPAADELFQRLREQTPWKHEIGRGRPFPRLTAWYADAGTTYRYSGVAHHGEGWSPDLLLERQQVEAAAGAAFNSLLLNLYRDGRDSIGLHTDAEPELGQNPVVASISLGAVREFVLKHIATRETLKYPLAHGSLLVMGGTSQHHWLHGVPKTKTVVGERINLTFRNILR